jgi:AP2-associated kinase
MEEVNKQSQADQAVSTQNASVDGSASPDRPYQGVGKLIDQWQRITAEAEAPRNAIPGKRANVATSK